MGYICDYAGYTIFNCCKFTVIIRFTNNYCICNCHYLVSNCNCIAMIAIVKDYVVGSCNVSVNCVSNLTFTNVNYLCRSITECSSYNSRRCVKGFSYEVFSLHSCYCNTFKSSVYVCNLYCGFCIFICENNFVGACNIDFYSRSINTIFTFFELFFRAVRIFSNHL